MKLEAWCGGHWLISCGCKEWAGALALLKDGAWQSMHVGTLYCRLRDLAI